MFQHSQKIWHTHIDIYTHTHIHIYTHRRMWWKFPDWKVSEKTKLESRHSELFLLEIKRLNDCSKMLSWKWDMLNTVIINWASKSFSLIKFRKCEHYSIDFQSLPQRFPFFGSGWLHDTTAHASLFLGSVSL